MWDLECPVCKKEFQVVEWSHGECSNCGNEYYFDEACTDDYSDCWTVVEWENWS